MITAILKYSSAELSALNAHLYDARALLPLEEVPSINRIIQYDYQS